MAGIKRSEVETVSLPSRIFTASNGVTITLESRMVIHPIEGQRPTKDQFKNAVNEFLGMK